MSPGDDDCRCQDCNHYCTLRSGEMGECRANPPSVANALLRSDDVVVRDHDAIWPIVRPLAWCGAWKPLDDD